MSDNNNDNILSCANCGKGEEESINLKYCSACKLVKYCSAECQKAHRPMHKNECKKRAAELHDEALFKEHPPTEDCPICMIPLPIDKNQSAFYHCCGKHICKGCVYGMIMGRLSKGKITDAQVDKCKICPFCRNIPEEGVESLQRLADKDNAQACFDLSRYYIFGLNDLPRDMKKAHELLLKAGKLGKGRAFHNLGVSYENGSVERDLKKSKHFYELAVINGNVASRTAIGNIETRAGNIDRAKRHFLLGARAGDTECLDLIKVGYTKLGFITKDEYADALRAYQKRRDEMKSDDRENAKLVMAKKEQQKLSEQLSMM